MIWAIVIINLFFYLPISILGMRWMRAANRKLKAEKKNRSWLFRIILPALYFQSALLVVALFFAASSLMAYIVILPVFDFFAILAFVVGIGICQGGGGGGGGGGGPDDEIQPWDGPGPDGESLIFDTREFDRLRARWADKVLVSK